MDFIIPQGGSSVCEINVEPLPPGNSKAQPWKMTNVTAKPPVEVDTLDMIFSKNSSKAERQIEKMVLVFSIPPSSNAGGYNWRFFGDGLMYCDGKEDYLDRISPAISNNGKTLTLTVSCLGDQAEDFAFSFLAIRQDKVSGECQIFSSEDPGGSTNRGGN
ncbi:hypothetical protein [Haliea sp. E17]|uniref:hypothetical protein n=1 Tax=Haliea sp. E17 TaxID=3401576 RepID=UPI003AAFD1BF